MAALGDAQLRTIARELVATVQVQPTQTVIKLAETTGGAVGQQGIPAAAAIDGQGGQGTQQLGVVGAAGAGAQLTQRKAAQGKASMCGEVLQQPIDLPSRAQWLLMASHWNVLGSAMPSDGGETLRVSVLISPV